MQEECEFWGQKSEIDYIDLNKILAFQEELLINYICNLKKLKELNEFKK